MVIPKEYGGQGRTYLERFVVTEELLVVGAPVAAHWFAERQIGPSLLAFGTEEQKQAFLPGISRGELVFGIGMSEPDSGSDLASVRTRAERVDGGWRLTGTKVWTSGAHEADAFFALARSAPLDPAHRHDGLSQFIVDLRAPGVDIRPIVSMGGDHHFNEVHLDGVFIPDDRVLGTVGAGWKQVTSELGFERSGPERVLSTFQLLAAAAQAMADGGCPLDEGWAGTSRGWPPAPDVVRRLVRPRSARPDADLGAAVVKVLGTTTRATSPTTSTGSPRPAGWRTRSSTPLLHAAILQRPGFTLRGGTNEILRG